MARIKETFGNKNKFEILADAESNMVATLKSYNVADLLSVFVNLTTFKGYDKILTMDSLLGALEGFHDFDVLKRLCKEADSCALDDFPSDSVNPIWVNEDDLNESETPAAFAAYHIFKLQGE